MNAKNKQIAMNQTNLRDDRVTSGILAEYIK